MGVVADSGLFLLGTMDLRKQTASGECNGLPMSVAILLLNRCLLLGCKILEQHAVHKNVPTTHFAQEDTSSRIIEEANVV